MPEMDASRSPAGGWSGVGTATHGDFVQVKRGNVHIVAVHYNGVETVCGGWYPTDLVTPASGDEPKQCRTCWDRM